MFGKMKNYNSQRAMKVNSDLMAAVMEWEEIAKFIMIVELSKDRKFIPNKEMVIKENLEELATEVTDAYEVYSKYRYFNALEYVEQKDALLSVVLVNRYLKKNEDWLLDKMLARYTRLYGVCTMQVMLEEKLDYDYILITETLRKKTINKVIATALYVVMANQFFKREGILELEIDEHAITYALNLFEYEDSVVFERYREQLPPEFIEDMQAIYKLNFNENWKFKEKKNLSDVIGLICGRLNDDAVVQGVESGLYDLDVLTNATKTNKKVVLFDWASALTNLLGEYDLKEYRSFEKRLESVKRLGLAARMVRLIGAKEMIEMKRKLLKSEIKGMVDALGEEKRKRANAQLNKRGSSNDRLQNELIATLEEKVMKLTSELNWAQEQLKRTKQNAKITEQQNREILKKLKGDNASMNTSLEVELKVLEDEVTTDAREEVIMPDGFKLPERIVMVTGHPNLRNKVKRELGWEVVDIDKLAELNKLNRADLIVYNSESSNHTVFEKMSTEELERTVYIGGITNLALILKKVTEEWYLKTVKFYNV